MKNAVDLRKQLNSYKYEFDLLQKVECPKEESKRYLQMVKNGEPLPEGVYRYVYENGEQADIFYTIYKPDLTDAEIAEYLSYKQLGYIKTIKNCVLFFTIIAIISLTVSLLAVLGAF